ncbi:DinB family protein [Muricauda sp. SCSIO 64092]|uniref:DinB family protein n=1 Tax=Allomuricauda sp. SCSIO 64092 TaxID=2908842 RepID=UPI001FF12001|nr:DinB family protein [Muricauda sp. SCSIO 64092]UOY06376.1 DinB family protein [Muricauda sp. SCSIO 64092]
MNTSKPEPSEYHPYYSTYIEAMGDVPLLPALEEGLKDMQSFMARLEDHKLTFAYDTGKWTVAEVLVHLLDTERIFQYRALRFARNDRSELPGFEQDDYVVESFANQRTKAGILEEFMGIRQASISLFRSFNEDSLQRMGTASGVKMSVRALGYVICGHQVHHLKVLEDYYF